MSTCLIFTLICLRRHPKKTITVIAQKSYVIKKKIILDWNSATGMVDSSFTDSEVGRNIQKEIEFHMLAPLVKIDSKTVQVDIDADELSKCGGTQYELPIDPVWEIDRSK